MSVSAEHDKFGFAQYVQDVFLRPADEDYLLARMCALNGFWSHFCWCSQQSLEKYIKCYLAMRQISVRFRGRNTHDLEKLFQRALSETTELKDRPIVAPSGFPKAQVELAEFGEKFSSYVSRANYYGQPSQRYREVGFLIQPGDVHKLDELVRSLRTLCVRGENFLVSSGKRVLQNGEWIEVADKIPKEPAAFQKGGIYRHELTYGNYAFFPEVAQSEAQTIMAACFQLGAQKRIESRFNISDANITSLREIGVIE